MKKQNLLELIEETTKEVEKLGYSDDSIKKYSNIWNNLKEFCKDKYENYTVDVGNIFLETKYNISNTYYLEKGHHNSYRAIMILNSYMCYGEIYTKYFLKKHKFGEFYQNIYDEYLNYCLKEMNNSKKTVSYKKYSSQRLLFLLEKENIIDFNMINVNVITKYLETLTDISHNSFKLYIYTLRDFFIFLYKTNRTKINLQYLIPKAKISKYPSIPSVWKKEDVEKLISVIDKESPIGKRDYAMLLLTAKLGIRVMDLKHLTFDNIDWQKKEINFVMSKTKKTQNLPLPNDVGWAIIDYLKNGRPVCNSRVIFIRHVKPIGPFEDSDSLSGIIKKYINLSGITFDNDLHKKGMHSLRHSLATNLLKNNIPINNISLILGQNNRSSVSYYLKVDDEKLRKCCGSEDFYDI